MAYAEFGLRRFRPAVDSLAAVGILDFARENLYGIGPPEPNVLEGILGHMHHVRDGGIKIQARRLVKNAIHAKGRPAHHVAAYNALGRRKFRLGDIVYIVVFNPDVYEAVHEKCEKDEQNKDCRLS
jgi:hypothetical protein